MRFWILFSIACASAAQLARCLADCVSDQWMDESVTAINIFAVFVHLVFFVFIQVFSENNNEPSVAMKRRNVDSAKIRRTLKKNKISDGLCGRYVNFEVFVFYGFFRLGV